jgi:hypothetical protein
MIDYYKKYIKYKQKYNLIKTQNGGTIGITKDLQERKKQVSLVIDEEFDEKNQEIINNYEKNDCLTVKHKGQDYLVHKKLKIVQNLDNNNLFSLSNVHDRCYSKIRQQILPYDYTQKKLPLPNPPLYNKKYGINNYGNTCFANASIHFLRSMPELFYKIRACQTKMGDIHKVIDGYIRDTQKSFLENPQSGLINKFNFLRSLRNKPISELKSEYFNFINYIGNYNELNSVVNAQCMESFINFSQLIVFSVQNDAHEFITNFLDTIYLNIIDNSTNIKSNTISYDIVSTLNHLNGSFIREIIDPPHEVFMITVVKETDKNNKIITKSLTQLIEHYFSQEIIDVRVEGKSIKVYQQQEIRNLKRYLLLQLKNVDDSGELIVAPILIEDTINIKSRGKTYICHPISIIEHQGGGSGGGHYINYSKRRDNKWYEYNDSHVKMTDLETIRNNFIQFYESERPTMVLLEVVDYK